MTSNEVSYSEHRRYPVLLPVTAWVHPRNHYSRRRLPIKRASRELAVSSTDHRLSLLINPLDNWWKH
jgi:hypothetical protein